jgi:large subunit ribosomal protein L19
MNRLSRIEQGMQRQPMQPFRVGDTVRVYAKITEGEKERTQVFEGTVIARKGGSNREMITVRKVSFGVGVERIFPLHAPTIEKVEVLREGQVRRSKLYYLRGKKGRAAKIMERGFGTESAVAEPADTKAEPVQSASGGVSGGEKT